MNAAFSTFIVFNLDIFTYFMLTLIIKISIFFSSIPVSIHEHLDTNSVLLDVI